MSKLFRLPTLAWLAVALCALGFMGWANAGRIRHVQEVSASGNWAGPAPGRGSHPSELAAGNRLIVPEQLAASYHWMAQTQRMFQRGEWRVRHIDYENAPFGREVHSASLYRWWLGLVAWGDHLLSDRPAADAVERAALVADPLLHVLLLLAVALLVAWRFGPFAAAISATGLAGFFPFAAEYLPGAPDDRGLAQAFALIAGLLLAIGARTPPASESAPSRAPRWFFLAGVVGGLGLWLKVDTQLLILVGVGAGAVFAALAAHGKPDVLPWRAWSAGGAITIFAAYLVEFAPDHLGAWQPAAIHPLHGLAWLGAGELLAQVSQWIQTRKFPRSPRTLVASLLALVAVAALPVFIWKTDGAAWLDPDPTAFRLTRLPDGAVAPNLATLLFRAGPTSAVVATLTPLLLLIPAFGLLLRRATGQVDRAALALTMGPVLVAFAWACRYLAWWGLLDGSLLVVIATAAAIAPVGSGWRCSRPLWLAALVVLLLPGMRRLGPAAAAATPDELTRAEVLGLVERDLAGWLARRADPGGVVVLAPPNETTGLCYYGSLRGIGSLSWENKDGAAAAVRVLSAPSPQEAKELIDRRGITHLILLSWDTQFDEYARAGTGRIEGSFRDQLRFATLPLWLRPLSYRLPAIGGFERESVTVLAVVDDQDEATALSRIASYLVETGQLDEAAAAAQGLRRFPAELGAWVARAEVESARGDDAGLAASLKVLQARLAARATPSLPWDQRVGLAIVLAKAKLEKLSREQIRVCVAGADEEKLRQLPPGTLYRLLVLSRAFAQPLDPTLQALALDLVPAEMRARLP